MFDPTIVAAIIGFVGVLIGAYIGYRQWKINQRVQQKIEVHRPKKLAYEGLWKLVAELHFEPGGVPGEKLQEKVTELTRYVLHNEVYISQEDRNLVNQYVEAVERFTRIARLDSSDAKALPLAIVNAINLRDELRRSVQKVLVEQ